MNDDPLRRPEVKNATIEFIASSEYMVSFLFYFNLDGKQNYHCVFQVRPPQPAIYLFILDVSRIATQTGYLSTVCEVLCSNLSKLPGDTRTSVGFITVDSAVRFYDLGEMLNQPHELIVTDVDGKFTDNRYSFYTIEQNIYKSHMYRYFHSISGKLDR